LARVQLLSVRNSNAFVSTLIVSVIALALPVGVMQLQAADVEATSAAAIKGSEEPGVWLPFEPGNDPFTNSPIDLRYLNERVAGEGGFIQAKGENSCTRSRVRRFVFGR
jgi:hypothetical protein